jgi:sulfatase modifying factor 1
MRTIASRTAARIMVVGLVGACGLVGCEGVLGLGSLGERAEADGGGQDATTGDGSVGSGDSGSGGDSDSGGDSGSDAACTTGASGCSGTQPEECIDGVWLDNGAACGSSQTCVSGACGGECGPGQGNCDGQQPQTCDGTGHWQNSGSACASETCVSGACTGVCAPSQTECVGATPQTCSSSGQWQPGTACSGATLNCSNGSCTATPPSCQPGGAGMTNCGTGSASCCTSLEVPGGTYSRTYTNSGSGPTGTADSATVSGFRLDEYEVTVGRFRQFVAAWNGGSGWLPTAGSGKHTHLNGGQGLANSGSAGTYETGWDATDWNNTTDVDPTSANLACNASYATWTPTAGSNEKLPINCVNWWESEAFCIWDGGFLPSEAEWEYAAAGGSQEREYPWGTTDPGTSSQYAIYNCEYPSPSGSCTGVSNIAPVGTPTAGAGVWGQLDLAGNVWEWNLDWYGTYVDPCTDCAQLTAASYRVIRGGDFSYTASVLLPPYRTYNPPTYRGSDTGFRCARTP